MDLADATVLVDCRWIGFSGIGRATELLIRSLAAVRPVGRWILWGPDTLEHVAWPGASVDSERRDPHELLGMRGILSRPKHDVAIYPDQLRPPGRAPAVQYLQDVTPIATECRRVPRAAKRRYFQCLARAAIVISPSDMAAMDIAALLRRPRERFQVFTYPYDADLGRRVARLRDNETASTDVLFVGRAAPHKNLDRLVAAHREARVKGCGRLVLVGPGTEAYDDPVHAIHGLGEVSQETLDERMAAAAALVLPSLREGFGLPVIEAQAAGLPVLASSALPLLDLLVAGWDVSFDPYDVSSIAYALAAPSMGRVPAPGLRPVTAPTFEEHGSFIMACVERALGSG